MERIKNTLLTSYFFVVVFSLVVSSVVQSQNSGVWSGSAGTWSSTGGDVGITLTATNYGTGTGFALNDFQTTMPSSTDPEALACNSPTTSFSEPSIVGNPAISMRHTFFPGGNTSNPSSTAILTFTFSTYVINPVIHLDKLGGGSGPGNGGTSTSSLLTLLTPGVTITRLSGNDTHFQVDEVNNTITREAGMSPYNNTGAECGGPNDAPAAGSVRVNGIVKSLTFEVSMNPDQNAVVNDRFEIAFSNLVPDNDQDGVPNATDICIGYDDNADVDSDGVPDGCDLDDDNDGILDSDECNDPILAVTEVEEYSGGWYQDPGNDVEISPTGDLVSMTPLYSLPTGSGVSVVEQTIGGITFHRVTGVSGTTLAEAQANQDYLASNIVIRPDVDPVAISGFIAYYRSTTGLPTVDYTYAIAIIDGATETIIGQDIEVDSSSQLLVSNMANATDKLLLPGNTYELRMYLYDAINDLAIVDNPEPYTTNYSITESCPDSDGDLVPDYLDTDSDNDGCPDAVEGAGSFTTADLVNFGVEGAAGVDNSLGDTVNDNGIPVPPGTAGNGLTGQGTTPAVIDDAISNACSADLSLNKIVSSSLPKIGDTITYTLTVKNDGPVNATGVQVTDALPTGVTYSSDNSGTTSTTYTSNIWNIGSLNSGQSISLQISATVTNAGLITNTSEITQGNEPDIDSTINNTN